MGSFLWYNDDENLSRNFEKSFPKCKKIASTKIFGHFLHGNFFMFVLKSNHTASLVQFRNKIALVRSSRSSLMEINSKLNLKPYDYLY